MSIIDTTLTNTVLVPSSDSLVSGHPLPSTTIVKDVEKFATNFNQSLAVFANQFKVYLKSGDKTVYAAYCESIPEIVITRNVETKSSGGRADYQIKLPGAMQYKPVTMVHLVTDNEVFLNWLINGAAQGGIQKADIEIRVGDEKDYMCYTLRDAFPVRWNFGTMAINVSGLVTNHATLTYSIKDGDILVENLDIAYGKIEYKRVTG